MVYNGVYNHILPEMSLILYLATFAMYNYILFGRPAQTKSEVINQRGHWISVIWSLVSLFSYQILVQFSQLLSNHIKLG